MDLITQTLEAVTLASRIILESGGETYRAEETVERMCEGLGFHNVDVLALPTGMMLTLETEEGSSLTRIVRVRNRAIDLDRIDQCNSVSRQVAAGEMTAQEALARLKTIHASQHRPAHQLLLIAASALSAAFFTLMLGGLWADFGVSLVCGMLVQLILPPLARRRVPTLISSLLAGH